MYILANLKMKSFIRIVIFLLICTILGLWSPWFQLDLDLATIFKVEKPESVSGLEVSSLLGELELYIDDVLQEGTATADGDSIFIVDIEPGEKAISIKRKSEVQNAFWEYRDILNFADGVNTVISLGLGPEQEFSEGTIITAIEKNNEEYNLKVNADLSDYQLLIDGIPYAVDGTEFTTSVSLDSQHTIRINKSGYEEIEFKILPEDQGERDALENFIINVDAILMLQPVIVE